MTMSSGRYLVSGICTMMGGPPAGIDQICGDPRRCSANRISFDFGFHATSTHADSDEELSRERCGIPWTRRTAPVATSTSCTTAPSWDTRAQAIVAPSGDQASVPETRLGVDNCRSTPVATLTSTRSPGMLGRLEVAGGVPRMNAIWSPLGDHAG